MWSRPWNMMSLEHVFSFTASSLRTPDGSGTWRLVAGKAMSRLCQGLHPEILQQPLGPNVSQQGWHSMQCWSAVCAKTPPPAHPRRFCHHCQVSATNIPASAGHHGFDPGWGTPCSQPPLLPQQGLWRSQQPFSKSRYDDQVPTLSTSVAGVAAATEATAAAVAVGTSPTTPALPMLKWKSAMLCKSSK